MLKKILRLNAIDSYIYLGVVGGAFLLIQLVTAGVMFFAKPDTSVMISQVSMLAVLGILLFIYTLSYVFSTFIQGIQFGATRKMALALTLEHLGVLAAVGGVLIAVLTALERAIAPTLWKTLSGASSVSMHLDGVRTPDSYAPGQEPIVSDILRIGSFSIDWWWIVVVALAAILLGLVVGAIFQRFGKKGGWMMWIFWMGFCFSPQFNLFHNFNFSWLPQTLAVVGCFAVVWSIWSLLHAQIKT